MNPDFSGRIRIGVSACLTGEKVRYDGKDKRNGWVMETLGRHFDLVPICPEVSIGLGVPREPIQLEQHEAGVRAVGVADRSRDVTEALTKFSERAAADLASVSGFIFKSRSPSCGLDGVPIHDGDAVRPGRGLFAHALVHAWPLVPVAEESAMKDAEARDGFLERVFACRRWQDLENTGMTLAGLRAFHAEHKLTVMAHSPAGYRTLGRLVADAEMPLPELAATYAREFMKALTLTATARKHANVLQHLMGYLKKVLSPADKAELLDVIERCRLDYLPRAAALTLLRHHFMHYPNDYVARQQYLYPSPEERNARGL